MKEKPKISSDKPLNIPPKLTSEEVWRMIERNLGYKLIPMNFSDLDKNIKEK
jgi:hypothetical protein